jgi:ABC-2 type transport system permease protein
MNKTARVVRQELVNNFRRPTYLIVAFGLPLLAILVLGVATFIQGRSNDTSDTTGGSANGRNLEVEGYVDPDSLIRHIPQDLPQGLLLSYDSEAQARQALDAGEISAYYLIPPDYVTSGEIFYIYPQAKSLLSDGQEWVMRWTLMVNLLGGDIEAAGRIWNTVRHLQETQVSTSLAQPETLSGEDCSRPSSTCESNELIRMIPSMMVALLFVSFMISSNLLFHAIGIEKEDRTLEVLLLSVSPHQMLAGKTIALGAAGLLQMVVWLAAVLIMFNIGGSTLNLPENFSFPIDILIWSLLFFLGGFAVYASMMAGVGALVPKMKEAGAANFIVMSPLFFGYIVGLMAPLAEATSGALPLILSIFPLTAPVVMIMRLTDGLVPLWQLLLSVGLLFITAYFVLRAVAALFRAQNLLSGQPFSMRRYYRVLLSGALLR